MKGFSLQSGCWNGAEFALQNCVLARRNQPAQLVGFACDGPSESRSIGFQVFQPGTGIQNYDAVVAFWEAAGDQLTGGSDTGTAFRRDKKALPARQFEAGVQHVRIVDRHGRPSTSRIA